MRGEWMRVLSCAGAVRERVWSRELRRPRDARGEATRLATAGAQARRARSPYEWTSAMLYLERSREVAGYARWQDALSLARRATALARAATARAKNPAAKP